MENDLPKSYYKFSGMDTEYLINSKVEGKENMPLHILLCEWALNNFSVPSDLSTAAVYVFLFMIAWYGVSLVARLIAAVLWPLILLASVVVVLRAIQFYESEQAYAVFHTVAKVVADILVSSSVSNHKRYKWVKQMIIHSVVIGNACRQHETI
uniref:Uncharacterized protein n=1 Tax=Glossina pallidipes TaxID=7398 RepID=A0A1A9ZJE7_GLOPL